MTKEEIGKQRIVVASRILLARWTIENQILSVIISNISSQNSPFKRQRLSY
jgi:hypothetical protein